jgi:hypothetical protein
MDINYIYRLLFPSRDNRRQLFQLTPRILPTLPT